MKQELLQQIDLGLKTSVNEHKNPLDVLLKKERNAELVHHLKSLSASELSLIYALFYDNITEADYALQANMDETTVISEKKRILTKLRKSFNTNKPSLI